jgi:Gpi18-like mannosyltransferase
LIALLIKLVYYIFIFFIPYPKYNRLEIKYFGEYFFQNYSNNDSGWYENIALNGYPDPQKVSDPEQLYKYAFFPLYPKLASLLIYFGLSTQVSFFIITTLISLAAFLLFYLFTFDFTKSESIAFNATLLLIVFPHHFYFSMYYTESLFLLLSVLSFYFIAKRKWISFAIASSLLVLTRINGIFLLLPLILYEVSSLHKNEMRVLVFRKSYLAFVPMIFTLLIYCSYLKIATGDFFAFKKYSEAGWGGGYRHFHLQLYTIL